MIFIFALAGFSSFKYKRVAELVNSITLNLSSMTICFAVKGDSKIILSKARSLPFIIVSIQIIMGICQELSKKPLDFKDSGRVGRKGKAIIKPRTEAGFDMNSQRIIRLTI
ncbi:hypothetical protein [Nitrosomonas sp. Nm166]|uniref:hypothetical protein n=1 Tax=Nitrosomonas sp. Nm166 TaxID=1881054 RepID=UPI0008E66341|nr:hypothetical protein [Nitrosomonas sp. Nm166]SFE98048.1 hypothetical protein SAMN05428977_104022 [Nitrosomonas sp. Nm166]